MRTKRKKEEKEVAAARSRFNVFGPLPNSTRTGGRAPPQGTGLRAASGNVGVGKGWSVPTTTTSGTTVATLPTDTPLSSALAVSDWLAFLEARDQREREIRRRDVYARRRMKWKEGDFSG